MEVSEYLSKLRPVRESDSDDFPNALSDRDKQFIENVINRINSEPHITIETLAEIYSSEPESLPILVSCLGWSLERLKNELMGAFNSTGIVKLARTSAKEVIAWIDQQFSLAEKVEAQRSKAWCFQDVVAERQFWSRRRGMQSVGQGRILEDVVEETVKPLGLTYEMRTTFTGRGNTRAPADLAIPAGGDEAVIVCAVKGFDSTGSKLTDAVREIESMAEVRRPVQYVLAVVDGVGWRRRSSDLARIVRLFNEQLIDGLFTVSEVDKLRATIQQAAEVRGLIRR